jgi:hypothetical protein
MTLFVILRGMAYIFMALDKVLSQQYDREIAMYLGFGALAGLAAYWIYPL